jgi:hypothetical protein
MNWLEEVLKGTEEAEAPRTFFFWSALAAISAVVKSRVYLDRFFYKLYPNVYVLLVAASGLRKGIPIAMAKAMVKEVDNTRVISGRNSIQGIIKDLSITVTTPGKPPLRDACGFIVSGEFSTVLIKDPEALTILTDLHDGHYNPEWKNTLKGTGVEELKGVNITVLGALNQTHFKDMISAKEVTGGFIARTMIVEETKWALKNPLLDKPKNVIDVKHLAGHLKKLAILEGEFKWDDVAKENYRKWYMSFNPEDHEDKTGTANRIHDQILKVAMLLSLARGTDLTILPEDLAMATKACSRFERTARTVTQGHGGQSEFGPKIKLLIDELRSAANNRLKRSTVLSKHYGDMDAFDLDRVVATLCQAGAVLERKVKGDIIYEATPKLMKEYERLKTI